MMSEKGYIASQDLLKSDLTYLSLSLSLSFSLTIRLSICNVGVLLMVCKQDHLVNNMSPLC